jgi:chromosome segregation ATPase
MEEAVQEGGINILESLEQRITHAVELLRNLRSENGQLQERLHSTQEELNGLRAEREETQALSAEFQKENGELNQRIQELTQELEELRGERQQVKSRIEKLLGQMDLLSAS